MPAESETLASRGRGFRTVPRAAEEAVLQVQGLTKSFGSTTALRDVDLAVRRGEFLTLLGPSGSGKTTLLRLIAGFERPTAGVILLHGRDVSRLSPAERGIGMVFQQYALFPHMTVEENLAYGLKIRKWPRDRRRARVAELLELLRLTGFERRYPRQLSGGQQQRVALGRALAYDPELILMDEPLGALDRALRIEMAAEIRRIHRDLDATVIHVTHDQQEALALSDRIAIMRLGAIVGLGSPEELYRRPTNAFVATFFGNYNLLPAREGERYPDGTARVACGGQEVRCAAPGPPGRPVALGVRPRSFRRSTRPGALRVAGIVRETVLLGDDRELVLDVPGMGRVVAVVEAGEAPDVRIGTTLELWASAKDAVAVPLEEGPAGSIEEGSGDRGPEG